MTVILHLLEWVLHDNVIMYIFPTSCCLHVTYCLHVCVFITKIMVNSISLLHVYFHINSSVVFASCSSYNHKLDISSNCLSIQS